MMIRSLILIGASLLAATAAAQYKHVGPDGRVTYSDTPPPAPAKGANAKGVPAKGAPVGAAAGATATTTTAGAATSPASAPSNLPYALQQVSRNFPVTLYTAADCGGCDQGRNHLNKRGIPFSEKIVKSNEEIDAFKKISGGAASIPLLFVGKTKLSGFEPTAWNEAFDTAGYPATSQLPASYRSPAGVPLIAEKPAATAEAKPKPDAAAAAPAPPPPPPPPAGDGGANRPGWFKGF